MLAKQTPIQAREIYFCYRQMKPIVQWRLKHDSPRHDLAAAIARNIYFGHEAAGAANSMALASYAQQCFELMSAKIEQILSGAEIHFPALPRQNKAA